MLNKLTVLCFSPTGGTAKAAGFTASALAESVETVDLLRPVTPRTFTAEDTVLIAMPVFGGRIPAYALEQLRAFQGGNARAVTLAVFGNRDFDDALLELNDAAAAAGFKVIASAAPIAEHSMVRSIGAGRPDAQDQKELAAFAGQVLAKLEKGDDSTPEVPATVPTRSPKTSPGRRWYPKPASSADAAPPNARLAQSRQTLPTPPMPTAASTACAAP